MANLDDALKSKIKILQLSGNLKLESLIEVLDTKLEGHPFGASAMKTDIVDTSDHGYPRNKRTED